MSQTAEARHCSRAEQAWSSLGYAQPQANSTAMSFELFNTCEFHHSRSHVLEPFLGEVSTCDVLDE
jgi:hypothetical protein